MDDDRTQKIIESLHSEAEELATEVARLKKLQDLLTITGQQEHVATTALSAVSKLRELSVTMQRALVFWAHNDLGMGQREIGRATGLSNRTINTWVKSTDEREQSEAIQTFIAIALDRRQSRQERTSDAD